MIYELMQGITGNIIRQIYDYEPCKIYYDKNKDFWRIDGEYAVGKITVKLEDLAFEKPPKENFMFGGMKYNGKSATHCCTIDAVSHEQSFAILKHTNNTGYLYDRIIVDDLYWTRSAVYRFDPTKPYIDNPPYIPTNHISWEIIFNQGYTPIDCIIVGENKYTIGGVVIKDGRMDFVDGSIYSDKRKISCVVSSSADYKVPAPAVIYDKCEEYTVDEIKILVLGYFIFSVKGEFPSEARLITTPDGKTEFMDLKTGKYITGVRTEKYTSRLLESYGFTLIKKIDKKDRIIFDDDVIIDSDRFKEFETPDIHNRGNTYIRMDYNKVVIGHLAAQTGARTKPALRSSDQ